MAAVGYFSGDRDINAGTTNILNADQATPALQRLRPAVTAVTKVCIYIGIALLRKVHKYHLLSMPNIDLF